MHNVSTVVCLLLINCVVLYGQKIGGITVVAPPDSVGIDAFKRVTKTNANWACMVPYGYHRKEQTTVKFNVKWQWWGEQKEGLVTCIRHAKKCGLNVMLKPQVYIPGSWVGDLDYDTEEEWLKWEKSYTEFIDFFLAIAIEEKVDMFCIGTEYKKAILERELFWRTLIKSVRTKYEGDLVYSSNWDNYKNVPFWDDLDFIGISAYFPLSEDITPSLKSLEKAWKPVKKELSAYAENMNKEILFTEYGYLSIDQCAFKAWELEKRIKHAKVNEDAQANAYAAILSSFSNEKWWKGGFIWKWFPEGKGHEGFPEKDYTPQQKKAESVIKAYYGMLSETIE